MADAEIIPLGTGGRPGRGTGRQRPSQSSRDLAPKAGSGKAPSSAAQSTSPDNVPKQATPAQDAPKKTAQRKPAQKKPAQKKPGAKKPGTKNIGAKRPGPQKTIPKAARLATEPIPDEATHAGPSPAPKPVRKESAERTAAEQPAAQAELPRPAVGLVAVPDLPETPPNDDSVQDIPERSHGIQTPEFVAALGHAAQEAFGSDGERRLAEFLAFLRRRVTGDYAVDEYGLDPEVANTFLGAIAGPLAEKWFRVEVRGIENIPTGGGALIVSNHSGTLPLDALVTLYVVQKHTGRNLRALGADLVFKLPFVGELARKGGATLACNEDATRMLSGGELVGVWPEGFKGIGKPYSERYKLQRFGRGGFVSAAVRTGVPIVPCSVIGAEEIYPLIANIPALARLLGLPYIPITPFFPLLGLLGLIPLPSKWIIEFGEPIRTDAYEAVQAEDPMLTFEVTDQVREAIQQTLYTLLMERKSVFS